MLKISTVIPIYKLGDLKELLRNKEVNEKCKLHILKCIPREYYYMEQKPGQQQKERIAKFKSGNEIFESCFK